MSAQTITLLAALLAFAASIIATAVAAYNGRFGKFARERWWERQAEVYTRIIEALASMVYYHEEHLTAYEEGRSIPESLRAETGSALAAQLCRAEKGERRGRIPDFARRGSGAPKDVEGQRQGD